MKQKIIAAGLVVVSLILIGVGYVLAKDPSLFGLCDPGSTLNCLDQSIKWGIGETLYLGIQSLPILFLVTFFVRPDVFRLWWKFALPFAIFAFWVVIGISPWGGGGFMSYSRTEYTRFFSLWLTSSSLILIALKTFRPHWRAYYTIPAALILSFAGLLLVLT